MVVSLLRGKPAPPQSERAWEASSNAMREGPLLMVANQFAVRGMPARLMCALSVCGGVAYPFAVRGRPSRMRVVEVSWVANPFSVSGVPPRVDCVGRREASPLSLRGEPSPPVKQAASSFALRGGPQLLVGMEWVAVPIA
jgi:hypothetical protein